MNVGWLAGRAGSGPAFHGAFDSSFDPLSEFVVDFVLRAEGGDDDVVREENDARDSEADSEARADSAGAGSGDRDDYLDGHGLPSGQFTDIYFGVGFGGWRLGGIAG